MAAIKREIRLRANYLHGEKVQTVYFGGGTPSLLSSDEIHELFDVLHRCFTIDSTAEITLEANPDDLNLAYLKALKSTPINRLSLGIQSFSEADLQFFNRAHTANDSLIVLDNALTQGFDDLSVDLIYGSPTTSDAVWSDNLARLASYPVTHLSCYALTVEPKTALDSLIKHRKAPEVVEETAERQWRILQKWLPAAGFEQYEISNFARNERYAKHNTSYWQSVAYLGVGPSAHSYNGHSRQWNISNNALYISNLQQDTLPFELEVLSKKDIFNEYVMTSLRTKWGCNIYKFKENTPHLLAEAAPFLTKNWLFRESDTLILTEEGKLHADGIAADLFL
ncbi:MAG: radical family heme chaperone HemW [Bacteroidota bacterium]